MEEKQRYRTAGKKVKEWEKKRGPKTWFREGDSTFLPQQDWVE
jgi:hypothetical protein